MVNNSPEMNARKFIARETNVWNQRQKQEKRKLGARDRHALYELAHKKCENCGKKLEYESDMQEGHKKAYSKGGKTTLANAVCLCFGCNNRQGTDSWENFRIKYNKPIIPTATSHLIKTRVKKDNLQKKGLKPKKKKNSNSTQNYGFNVKPIKIKSLTYKDLMGKGL